MSNAVNRADQVHATRIQRFKESASRAVDVLSHKMRNRRAAAGYLIGRYVLGNRRDVLRDQRRIGNDKGLIPEIVYKNGQAKAGRRSPEQHSDSDSSDSSEISSSD